MGRFTLKVLVAAIFVALATAGGAGAYALRHTVWVKPGHCTKVRGARVCVRRPPVRTVINTDTVVQTVTQTVTNTAMTVTPPPPPTPLAVAVGQVSRETAWAGATDQHIAESAMNYVVGHISAGAYGFLKRSGLPLPTDMDPNSTLGAQAGICGASAVAFASIVQQFNLPVRSVQFSFKDPNPDNHIAVEVYYSGGWHFFDPTFGQFWTDGSGNVLSIDEVRSDQGTLVRDAASFTNLIEGTNDAGYETDPATTVTIGGASL